MGQTRRIIRIFVSSPDDMKQERRQLGEIVQSINRSWGHTLNRQFELVGWETHGNPGFGADPQDVLNKELPNDCEVYVGLMWCRFGTPTGRAGSGTEEEFNNAFGRFQRDPASVKIMFYFKEAEISPGDIDPDQLGRVREFRDSLPKKGGLFWTFKTETEFSDAIRDHLSRIIQEFEDQPHAATDAGPVENAADDDDDDLGILEYEEIWEETIDRLDSVTREVTEYTEDHGRQLREHTTEMQSAVEEHDRNVPRKKTKALISKAAKTIDIFGDKVNEKLPEFDDSLREAATSAAHIVRLETSSGHRDIEDMKATLHELTGLYKTISETHESLEDFQHTTDAIPPMTRALNRAKRKTVSTLQQLIDSMNAGKSIFHEAIGTLELAIENREEPVN